jgi:hypothetical protein
VDICERWIPNPKHPGGGFRKDMFGFIDLIALDRDHGIIAIQSCGQSFAEHLRKIIAGDECRPLAIEWLLCDGKIELWGWRKVKVKRGGKAMVWKPRIRQITMNDFFGGAARPCGGCRA